MAGGDCEPMVVDTRGGRMHVHWDEGAQATPNGQLAFFAEFLRVTGVFDDWVATCPLNYRSGNAPDKRDVLGTLLLAMLAGHRRYAHITGLRGDAVAAQALGMDRVVSEDAVRRAVGRLSEADSAVWLQPALLHSVVDALDTPWRARHRREHQALVRQAGRCRTRLQPAQTGAAEPCVGRNGRPGPQLRLNRLQSWRPNWRTSRRCTFLVRRMRSR